MQLNNNLFPLLLKCLDENLASQLYLQSVWQMANNELIKVLKILKGALFPNYHAFYDFLSTIVDL